MLDHLNSNNLLDPYQSAYRTGHSTESAPPKLVNDLLNALVKGQISILSLLDLSAAFNTIDHIILLSHLESSYGIFDTALAWFRSYLIDRSQTVSVNGRYSPSTPPERRGPTRFSFGTGIVCLVYQACVSCH